MRCSRFRHVRLLGLLLALTATVPAAAQDESPQDERPLAPGILTTIPPDPQAVETFSGPLPLIELLTDHADLDWQPNYAPKSETLLQMARQVTLRRPIWNLEFSFKPLRMLEVDVPQPSGKMRRKLIWYMVYRVRYPGYELQPSPSKDAYDRVTYPSTEPVNHQSRRFFPQFVLRSHEFNKEYLDRVIPAAVRPIEVREMRGGKLYNSVNITRVPIALSEGRNERGVWGVVTWEDVDPRIDYFSVYIQGLTNAFRISQDAAAYQKDGAVGSSRQLATKTLRLNFWRPGDTEREDEREIHFGVPVEQDPVQQQKILGIYGLQERLDYLWVYR